MKISFLRLLFLLIFCFASITSAKDLSQFNGRIQAADFETGFVKVRLEFSNSRFLRKGNYIYLWAPDVNYTDTNSCAGSIIGKSPNYLLLRLKEIKKCKMLINFTPGQSISLKSEDLSQNIIVAKELKTILNKKRLALTSRVQTLKDLIDSHPERLNAINKKYESLIDQLNLEWKKSIQKIEQENIYNLQEFKNFAMRLDEVDFKLEKYRIEDDNFYTDRWSLDPSLYQKK